MISFVSSFITIIFYTIGTPGQQKKDELANDRKQDLHGLAVVSRDYLCWPEGGKNDNTANSGYYSLLL